LKRTDINTALSQFAVIIVIDDDIVGNDEIITIVAIRIIGIGADADAMLFVIEDEIIGDHRIGRAMPEIDANAGVVEGDIVEDVAAQDMNDAAGFHHLSRFLDGGKRTGLRSA
jgi:hypothetical protein